MSKSRQVKPVKLCLQVTFASASTFASKFCIESMVTQMHTWRMGSQPNLCRHTQSVNTSTWYHEIHSWRLTQFDVDANADVTYKQSFNRGKWKFYYMAQLDKWMTKDSFMRKLQRIVIGAVRCQSKTALRSLNSFLIMENLFIHCFDTLQLPRTVVSVLPLQVTFLSEIEFKVKPKCSR